MCRKLAWARLQNRPGYVSTVSFVKVVEASQRNPVITVPCKLKALFAINFERDGVCPNYDPQPQLQRNMERWHGLHPCRRHDWRECIGH